MNLQSATRVALIAGLAALTGCATTGGSQLESSIYDTQHRVRNLETNIQPTIERLNQSVADQDARVTAIDEQTRRLQGTLEESQIRLDEMQRKLDDVGRMLARAIGVTAPASPSTTSTSSATQGVAPSEGLTMAPPPTVVTVPPASPAEPQEALTPIPSEGLAAGNAAADYEKALSSYRNQNYEVGIQQFNEYMRRYPDSQWSGNAQYWKAISHAKLGQYNDAIREFEKMRALYPTNKNIPLAMYNQAVAHSNLGQIPETETLLERLIREYPDDAASVTAREQLKKIRGN